MRCTLRRLEPPVKHLILAALLTLAACGGSDEPTEPEADQPTITPVPALPCQTDRSCL